MGGHAAPGGCSGWVPRALRPAPAPNRHVAPSGPHRPFRRLRCTRRVSPRVRRRHSPGARQRGGGGGGGSTDTALPHVCVSKGGVRRRPLPRYSDLKPSESLEARVRWDENFAFVKVRRAPAVLRQGYQRTGGGGALCPSMGTLLEGGQVANKKGSPLSP